VQIRRSCTSGVRRAGEIIAQPPTDTNINIEENFGHSREDIISQNIKDAFQLKFAPSKFAEAISEFHQIVLLECKNEIPKAQKIMGSVFATFSQSICWQINPPVPKPLRTLEMQMDIDYQTVVGIYSIDKLLEPKKLWEDSTADRRQIELSHDKNSPCYKFVKFWVRHVYKDVLGISETNPTRKTFYRGKGVEFAYNNFVRESAFVTSNITKTEKRNWYYIMHKNAHDDANHFSIKPAKTASTKDDKQQMKKHIFTCALFLGKFINDWWPDKSKCLNTEDDFNVNKYNCGNHLWRVYGGPLLPLVLPLLVTATLGCDCEFAMQTYGGKRTGLSTLISVDVPVETQDDYWNGIASRCHESIMANSFDKLIFVFHRFVDLITSKKIVKSNVQVEDGIGVTIRGVLNDTGKPAFVAFASESSKLSCINDDDDDDDNDDGDDEDDEDGDENDDDNENVTNTADNIADAEQERMKRISNFFLFSATFPSPYCVHNLTKQAIKNVKDELNLNSEMLNMQLYCPTINNLNHSVNDVMWKAFGTKAVTSENGIMNLETPKQCTDSYFDSMLTFVKEMRSSGKPLGRMEVRIKMPPRTVDVTKALQTCMYDLVTICKRDLKGYPVETYMSLAEFSILALRGMQDAKLQLPLTSAIGQQEFYNCQFELSAQATSLVTGRSIKQDRAMYLAKMQ
jgi:hypothetical protein